MQDDLAAGLSAAEAARAALAADDTAPADEAAGALHLGADLGEALTEFDAIRAHALVDRLLAERGADSAVRDVIMPGAARRGTGALGAGVMRGGAGRPDLRL